MYYPDNKDIDWYFNEEVKEKRGGYKKKIIQIDNSIEEKYIELSNKLNINCYCRIDARIKCDSAEEWNEICSKIVPAEKIYFIEINPMPTLKHNINIHNAIDSLQCNQRFYDIFNEYKLFYNTSSQTGFILLCSMLANSKPCIEEKGI